MLRPLIGECKVYAYLDDLLINSKDIDSHVTDLERVLCLLHRYRVKLDPAKCDFAKSTIAWCGYVISGGKIRPDPSRLKILDEIIAPTASTIAKKPWQKLFGLLGYYRKFIPSYCHKESQIKSYRDQVQKNTLDSKTADSKISVLVKECVDAIKSVALVVPPAGSTLYLKTDASSLAGGWVLEDSKRHPILFGGTVWSATESTYSIFEKEMLSTLISIDKCKDWIQRAKRVIIYTDNSSCLLNYEGTTRNISARAIRFILRIQARIGPNVEYKHIRSLKNVVADYISRMEEDISRHPKFQANSVSHSPNPSENPLVDLSAEQVTDKCDCEICTRESLLVTTRSAKKEADIRERVRQIHALNHAGQEKLYQICKKQNISHVNLKQIIRAVTVECPFCMTEMKLLSNKVLGVTQTPAREMYSISCDHTYMPVRSTNGMKYMVTIVDSFSKFLTAIPVENLTMKRFCQILSQYLLQYPQVREVRFDNAFNSESVRETCRLYNVTPILNASFNSRENCVERAHLTLKSKILTYMAQNNLKENEWHAALSASLNAMNTVPHASTGYSPVEVVFNHAQNLYEYDDDTSAHPDKIKQRADIYSRLVSKKQAQSSKTVNPAKGMPRLAKNTVIIIRYGPRNPKFYAHVLKDHGMTLTIRRFDINNPEKSHNQHGVIKVAKRHVYLPKPTSHELKNINIYQSIRNTST